MSGEIAAVHPNGGIEWKGNLMPYPWWGGSVSAAIYMIGLERNSDKIIGVTYVRSLWQPSLAPTGVDRS